MKMRLALLATLCIAAASAPACAHHQSPPKEAGFLAFWKGIPPGSGVEALSRSPDFWAKAFVSKYSIVGFGLPSTTP